MKPRLFLTPMKIGIALFLFATLAACETDPLIIPGESEELTEISERVHPKITILSPQPGTFAVGDEIVISGVIEEGSAPLTELSVNREAVPYDGEETFEVTVTLEAGPNIFGLRVNSEDNGRGVDAVTVYGASTHPPGELLENALQVQLGQEALDNNTPQLDDLAGILEALIKDDQFLESLFDEPFEVSEDTTLTVERVDITDARIDILATPGCLDTLIVLGEDDGNKEGSVEIDLTATGIASILGDLILLSAKSISIEAYICPEGEDGEVYLEIYDPEVTFEEFRIATDDNPFLADDFPNLTAALATMAEDALANWMADSMADLVLELLEDFVPSYVFGEAPEVTALFELQEIKVDTFGILLGLNGSFSALQGLPFVPENVGSMRTDDPPLSGGFSDAPVAVAMSDDALNQLLFAIWYGGGIAEYDLPADEMDALPDVFQPLSSIGVDLWLPTTFVPPTYPDEYPFDMAVGGIDIELLSGEDRYFEMDLHLQAGVSLRMDDEGLLGLDIDNRAQRITVQAGVAAAPESHDPGDIAALLRMMVPPILGEVGVTYGGFPIPAFDLSELSENLSSFENRAISFDPSGLIRGGQGGGYLVVEGAIVEVNQ